MTSSTTNTRRVTKWAMPVAAVVLGLAIGSRTDLSFASPASAAPGFGPIEKLLIETDIRNRIALYTFYADGDGIGGSPRDLRKLADTLMTSDVVSEIYPANGSGPIILKGRDIVAKSPPEVDPEKAARIAGRHYNVSTAFDLITPTTVQTRTASVYFDATRNRLGVGCSKAGEGACGQVPVKTVMWVYHMTWKKTPDGWQISRNVLRDDN